MLMHSTSYLQLPICCTATVSVEALIGSAFRCSAPAVWNSLPQTVLSSDSVAVFKSMVKTFLISQDFSSSLLTNSLPGPSASEVTTLLRYTNLFIIIIVMSGSPPCTVCSVASLHVYDVCRRIDFSVHSATTCRTTAEKLSFKFHCLDRNVLFLRLSLRPRSLGLLMTVKL